MIRNPLCILLLISVPSALADDAARILIVVGPSTHPPWTHEVAAGGRLMEHCLDNSPNIGPVAADVVYEWPTAELRRSARTIVFIGDAFPPNRFENPQQNLADVQAMMDRGCGIVGVHYATGLFGDHVADDGDHPLLRWMGGYFANRSCPHHESIARIFNAATIEPTADDHPIARGWQEFTLDDEPYINNYFGKDNNQPAANVTIVATSMLPPAAPRPEAVAWCVEREDTGRGFGVVMPHYYKNWGNDDLRRLILNGIVWTAQLEVPRQGVESALPDLAEFKPAAVK